VQPQRNEARDMMMHIAKEKALPFEPLIPNDETIEAMNATRRGELVKVETPISSLRA
jgi:DNA-damage-inducible protein J